MMATVSKTRRTAGPVAIRFIEEDAAGSTGLECTLEQFIPVCRRALLPAELIGILSAGVPCETDERSNEMAGFGRRKRRDGQLHRVRNDRAFRRHSPPEAPGRS